MRKLIVFNNITVDGYFAGANGDIGWIHRDDPELREFVRQNAASSGVLIFGRITYDLMARYWPTPLAFEHDPVMAARMNERSKVVFSRTLERATWNNTKLVKADAVEEIRKMKEAGGENLVILGSGSIVAQLARHRLIDEYQLLLCPVALGSGKTMLEGIQEKLVFQLVQTRVFGNGDVFLRYEPAPPKNISGPGN